MRDGVRLVLKQLVEAAERAEAGLPPEQLFGGVLAELCRMRGLASAEWSVRERTYHDRVCARSDVVRMLFVKSTFVGGGFRSSSDDSDRTLNVTRQ